MDAEHSGHDITAFYDFLRPPTAADEFCQECLNMAGGGSTPKERWYEEEEARRYDNAREIVEWVNKVTRVYG